MIWWSCWSYIDYHDHDQIDLLVLVIGDMTMSIISIMLIITLMISYMIMILINVMIMLIIDYQWHDHHVDHHSHVLIYYRNSMAVCEGQYVNVRLPTPSLWSCWWTLTTGRWICQRVTRWAPMFYLVLYNPLILEKSEIYSPILSAYFGCTILLLLKFLSTDVISYHMNNIITTQCTLYM